MVSAPKPVREHKKLLRKAEKVINLGSVLHAGAYQYAIDKMYENSNFKMEHLDTDLGIKQFEKHVENYYKTNISKGLGQEKGNKRHKFDDDASEKHYNDQMIRWRTGLLPSQIGDKVRKKISELKGKGLVDRFGVEDYNKIMTDADAEARITQSYLQTALSPLEKLSDQEKDDTLGYLGIKSRTREEFKDAITSSDYTQLIKIKDDEGKIKDSILKPMPFSTLHPGYTSEKKKKDRKVEAELSGTGTDG